MGSNGIHFFDSDEEQGCILTAPFTSAVKARIEEIKKAHPDLAHLQNLVDHWNEALSKVLDNLRSPDAVTESDVRGALAESSSIRYAMLEYLSSGQAKDLRKKKPTKTRLCMRGCWVR